MLQIDPNLHHNNLVKDTTMYFKEEFKDTQILQSKSAKVLYFTKCLKRTTKEDH